MKPVKTLMFAILLLFLNSCNNTFKQGEVLYKNNCANCHMLNGEGLQSLIPPLAGIDYLSENRAKAVAKYIADKGIDASRLESKGFGESNPVDSNKTRDGRANNRRVEIKVTNE